MREPAVGDVLGGKYEVRGVLGRGGMGVVLSAWHPELHQMVAIKCLVPDALAIPDVVERFAREARAAAQIRGEHVVRVLDVGKFEDGAPFLVMEQLEGRDLAAELTARGRLPVAEAIRYVLETCEALAQAHVARIVHRDLKPSNLFLAETPGRRPVVKVLDFGISKIVDPTSDAITKTANVIGTAHYMSPEQLLSARSVDERSDLWALGIILHQLLVGQPPFVGESAPAVIAKIIKNEPPAPRSLRDDIPAGVEAVILRCLRTEPRERFADVGELASALLPFAAAEDAGSVAAIARVLATSSHPRPSSARVAAESERAPGAPAATPLEIASTVHDLSGASLRTRRRLYVAGGAAVLLAGAGVWVASQGGRAASGPPPSASIAPPVSTIAASAAASAPAAPSATAPIGIDAAIAPPARSAPAPAPTPVPSPRPRPVASAPRPAPSASSSTAQVPTASPSTNSLDIPLR